MKDSADQHKHWKFLARSYQEFGLVLCFGAGVSQGCRLPTWHALLESISSSYLDDETQTSLKQLARDKAPTTHAETGTPLVASLQSLGS